MRRIKHGSSDAFLIGLFSQAFGMQTDFVAPVELIPEYQALLDHWHSHDEAMFAAVMQKAADFHISRSKQNTDHTRYEFDATLDQVFPPSYWPCRHYAAARACRSSRPIIC
ncbi:hypothetical protein [Xanthomonas cucurbitae]|uniref:hypothetical protein n=1 Tax=Xanthomonas cucurbitae TaxID=56453 RepID=UPI00132EA8B0|nr:hypothetical protein [Xanthomonas cucurbitae]QHG87269.1 hypothetical protein EBN15_09980 [Xanthomonas cucurbitae]